MVGGASAQEPVAESAGMRPCAVIVSGCCVEGAAIVMQTQFRLVGGLSALPPPHKGGAETWSNNSIFMKTAAEVGRAEAPNGRVVKKRQKANIAFWLQKH